MLYNIILIFYIIIFVCAEKGRVLNGEAQEMGWGGVCKTRGQNLESVAKS